MSAEPRAGAVRRRRSNSPTAAPRLLALGLLGGLALGGCEGGEGGADGDTRMVVGGSASRGAAVIEKVGCGACHTIPGMREASATVGPPLTAFSRRSFIAGTLPNSPDNLVRWIMDPPSVEPRTAMPRLGLERQEAMDVAAYLYTLY